MKLFLTMLMLSSFAQAQVSQGEISNFNFNYTAPLGEGTADAFSYQQKRADESQKVKVEKIGSDFKIHLEGVENRDLTFANPPKILAEASEINLEAFNLTLQDRALLSMNLGSFHSPDQELNLKNFDLSCDRIASIKDLADQVISGCVQKMNLRVGGFSSLGGEGVEQALMKAFDQSHEMMLSSVGIKNLDLRVTSGKYQLSADIKAQISGTATSKGNLSYDVAAKKLTVKVSEVKFGFVDLTGQVFEELKKQESATMQVSKPYIYITIK